jgi:hypothetical protein
MSLNDWRTDDLADHLAMLDGLTEILREVDEKLQFVTTATSKRAYAVFGIRGVPLIQKPEAKAQPIRLEPKGARSRRESKYFKVSARAENTCVWVEKARSAGFTIMPSDMHPHRIRFRPLTLAHIRKNRKFLKDLFRSCNRLLKRDRGQ